jgi:hypothetical protein
MSILLRKEIRLLAPAWLAALAAATTPVWFGHYYEQLWLPCFGLAILFLGLSPFGQEMNWGTFGLLLSQPEKRQRFWRIKAGLLALALLSVWAIFAQCCGWARSDDYWDAVGVSGLMTLLAYSSGLWTTLLLRDVTTAFFAALIAPTLLCAATVFTLSQFKDILIGPPFLGVMAVYIVAGYLVARRIFLVAEDVPSPWTGGQISMPKAGGWPLRWRAFGFQEKRGPWSALICKELRLQEVTMVIVPLLLLLHLAALAARHYALEWAARMQVFDFAGFLWLVAPFVAGCVAVAEERRYNTLESFLCLPVRQRSQFAVKFAVVMALGTVLGGVLPWALESMGGGKIGWGGFETKSLVCTAAAIAALAFFASTMSRGMLQGFTVALLFPILSVAAVGLLLAKCLFLLTVIEYSGWLFPSLAVPALLIAYFWLAFRNFKSLQTGWPLWAGNFIRLASVFASVVLVAGAIFERPWEYLMPLEPHHGPARLEGSGRAMIAGSWSGLSYYALLPDGRLWAGQTDQIKNLQTVKHLFGHFVGGSNWVDLAAGSDGAVALKFDGTLWKISGRADPAQIGSDSDWSKVVAGSHYFLALKQDGAMWGWGDNWYQILANLPEGTNGLPIKFPDPVRVWQDSDWVDVFALNSGQAMAVKRDGSLWRWGFDQMTYDNFRRQHLGKNISAINVIPYHQLIRVEMDGTNWSSLVGDEDGLMLGVRTDGSLWGRGSFRYSRIYGAAPNIFGYPMTGSLGKKPVRIGTKSDWVGVSGRYAQVVALEADGTIWAMDQILLNTRHPSQYHDWLAASEDRNMTLALAKDGTISCWRVFYGFAPFYEDSDDSHRFKLRPSRRPLASLNILDAQ